MVNYCCAVVSFSEARLRVAGTHCAKCAAHFTIISPSSAPLLQQQQQHQLCGSAQRHFLSSCANCPCLSPRACVHVYVLQHNHARIMCACICTGAQSCTHLQEQACCSNTQPMHGRTGVVWLVVFWHALHMLVVPQQAGCSCYIVGLTLLSVAATHFCLPALGQGWRMYWSLLQPQHRVPAFVCCFLALLSALLDPTSMRCAVLQAAGAPAVVQAARVPLCCTAGCKDSTCCASFVSLLVLAAGVLASVTPALLVSLQPLTLSPSP